MNEIYKRIWSKVKERWILVSEKVAAGSCPSGIVGAITLAAFLSCSSAAFALDPGTLPTGGKITAGTGSISTTGRQMTVNQSSNKMIANWETFNIGRKAGVTFRQPDADSTALNRISDQNPSQILGTLSANGKIFLINPSGIVFGKGAQVNVGGLVASSLNILDNDFLAGKYKFYNAGFAEDAGKIINQGDIKTEPGGVVALIAPKVTNEGTITAESGSVVLAAGNQVSLDFKGDGLISYKVDQGAVDALAENKGLLKADGGLVVMTAKAADSLTGAVVNQSGVIEAQTLQNKEGRILLLSDMETGRTIVSGKLDASAPNGGNGGFIETSAHDVKLNDNATVTTNAPQGVTGTWLIDPTDFIVGTDISGAALSANLNNANVTIQTASEGTGNGDIFVNEAISWRSNKTLTLSAYNDININANITATGTKAGLTISPNTGNGSGNYHLKNGAVITLSGLTPSLNIAGNVYTVINNGNGGVVALQNMNNNLSGYYALGSNINAGTTSKWNSGAGFVPIGNNTTAFTGQFDGLGHTISNLYINRPSEDYVGLFGYTSNAVLCNVGIVNSEITGQQNVGALVGRNNYKSKIDNAYSAAKVSGVSDVGGLVGLNSGWVNNSYASAVVSGGNVLGGLVGQNGGGHITNSSATGRVTGESGVGDIVIALDINNDGNNDITGTIKGGNIIGGLVGLNAGGTIDGTTASGHVSGGNILGGLVGLNTGGQITNSSATGSVTGKSGIGDITLLMDASIDGAVALSMDANFDGNADLTGSMDGLSDIYAAGTIKGGNIIGGLVGLNAGGTIDGTTASGSVSGGNILGGLVGLEAGGQITNSSATGSVAGESGVGDVTFSIGASIAVAADLSMDANFDGNADLIGSMEGLSDIYAAGTIKGGNIVGGLVGLNAGGTIDGTTASGHVTGGNILGGLVGLNTGGHITNSSATGSVAGESGVGDVTFSIGASIAGAADLSMDANFDGNADLIGSMEGLSDIYAAGTIKGGNIVGGLVGLNAGGTIDGTTASGHVSGGNILGGLVGLNTGGQITNSSATGSVTGESSVGDITLLMDANFDGIANINGGIDGSIHISAMATIEGGNIVGGLVGFNAGGTIDETTASGNVSGGSTLDGLVGLEAGGQITNSSATGSVTERGSVGDVTLLMD